MKKDDRRIHLSGLKSIAHELDPPAPPPEPMPKLEIDREKAAEWFAQQGIRVVSAG
jgi:hypothetical protein